MWRRECAAITPISSIFPLNDDPTFSSQATDGGTGTHIISQTIFLALNDVNDIAPVFQSTPLALVTIAESSAKSGSVVTTVRFGAGHWSQSWKAALSQALWSPRWGLGRVTGHNRGKQR